MNGKQMIIVLGLDTQKKSHAAKFDLAQGEAVRKAAALMGFRTALPKSEEAIALAERLTPGKLFDAGKGLVPFCKAETHEKLLKAVELEPEAAKPPAAPSKPIPGPAKGPSNDPWADLKVGNKVIAQDGDEGWWPSVVVAISKDGQKLTLRWVVGDPKQKPIIVKRRAVALLSNG